MRFDVGLLRVNWVGSTEGIFTLLYYLSMPRHYFIIQCPLCEC